MSRQIYSLSKQRPLLLALGFDHHKLAPQLEEAEVFVLDLPVPDFVAEVRGSVRLLSDLPSDALDALDRYDPDHTAIVIVPTFSELSEIAGRRVYGARLEAWRELEDKTLADSLWDECGVRRAPSQVVSTNPDDLLAAARRLDRGAGTVWAGDAREGFHGAALYSRWVRREEDAWDAAAFLGAHCDRARVMPFLEGIPCSIHAIVLPDGVSVFRPVEILTLRSGDSGRFLYAGVATFWDPSSQDREEMRTVARKVGAGLRRSVGFRGALTVDGILTADGFLPTELNPRLGAGLIVMCRGHGDIPITLLNLAVIEGETLGFQADELERHVLAIADNHRQGAAWTIASGISATDQARPVVFRDRECYLATRDEPYDGVLSFASSNIGGLVRLSLRSDRTAAGSAIGPLVAAAFGLADREFGASIGPLEAAQAVAAG